MAGVQIALWNVDEDVVSAPLNPSDGSRRTIIAAAGSAPPRGSIVICMPFAYGPIGVIAAVGRVQRQQRAATERVTVRVEPFFLLDQPIGFHVLSSHLDISMSDSLNEVMDRDQFSPRVLTFRESDVLLETIRRVSSQAATYIDRLLQPETQLDEPDVRRLREERDAVETAIRLSGLSTSAFPLPHQYVPDDSILQMSAPFGYAFDPRYLVDNEDDLLASDLRRFDDSANITEVAGSGVRIQDEDLELTVMNVNRKELEHVYGVDLIYYDHIRDKAIAVQYKRLELNQTARGFPQRPEWIYRNRSDLDKQLSIMEQYATSDAELADDWRLSSSPFFFKFVHQHLGPQSSSLLRGMYVPDEYLRLGIKEGKFNTGPMGGFQIHEGNTKYLTSTTFIELVRRCWIGTRRTDRSGLARRAAERAQEYEVILALLKRRVA